MFSRRKKRRTRPSLQGTPECLEMRRVLTASTIAAATVIDQPAPDGLLPAVQKITADQHAAGNTMNTEPREGFVFGENGNDLLRPEAERRLFPWDIGSSESVVAEQGVRGLFTLDIGTQENANGVVPNDMLGNFTGGIFVAAGDAVMQPDDLADVWQHSSFSWGATQDGSY